MKPRQYSYLVSKACYLIAAEVRNEIIKNNIRGRKESSYYLTIRDGVTRRVCRKLRIKIRTVKRITKDNVYDDVRRTYLEWKPKK